MADARALATALRHSTAGGVPARTPAQAIAAALAEHGRKGDTVLAHLNAKEVKLLNKLTDGASVNPKTGLLEFSEDDGGDSGGGDSGSDSGDSSDSSSGDSYSDAASDYGGAEGWSGDSYSMGDAPSDPSSGMDYDSPEAQANRDNFNPYADAYGNQGRPNDPYKQETTYDSANAGGKPGFGDWAGDKLANAVNNPATTLANMLIGQIPVVGQLNSLSGLVGGPTLGGGLTQIARDVSNPSGASPAQMGVSAGDPSIQSGGSEEAPSEGGGGGGSPPAQVAASGVVPNIRMRGLNNIPLVQGLQMWRANG